MIFLNNKIVKKNCNLKGQTDPFLTIPRIIVNATHSITSQVIMDGLREDLGLSSRYQNGEIFGVCSASMYLKCLFGSSCAHALSLAGYKGPSQNKPG